MAGAMHQPQPVFTAQSRALTTVDIDMFSAEEESGNTWPPEPYGHSSAYEDLAQPQYVAVNDEPLFTPLDKLTMATQVSMRYHESRKRHYDGIYKAMVFGIMALGAASFVAGFSEWKYISMGVLGLSGMLMVWNFNHKAREHDLLRVQYKNLLDNIRLTPKPNPQDIYNWRTLRMNIQSQEPPVFWTVANDCYYDVARAWDLNPHNLAEQRKNLPWLLRALSHWIRL
jgi:hypothetical protein